MNKYSKGHIKKLYYHKGGAKGTRFQIHKYRKRQFLRYYYKGKRR